jgi:tetratricopeptide (TPR) repeat protein/transcriptional regulator with XRE-family HTH domain
MNAKDAPKAKGSSRTIASRLKQEREQRAWTQSEVAERIGSTRINISRWENGITIPGPYYRQRLAELFGKNVQELGLISTGHEDAHELSASTYALHNTALWNIAHRRNPFFTGREPILNQIRSIFQSCHASGLILALTGLGGVGKTQIALEYAYTYRKCYQAIFWINAVTHDTLSNDFTMIASLLDLSKQQDQEEIIIHAVKHWLTVNTDWLLIFDNVDSLEMILNVLPQDSPGDILLTTRLQVLSTIAHSIEVTEMAGQEGITFLLRRTKLLAPGMPPEQITPENQQEAARIVDKLGGLPLALDQAGAYIEETGCGLSQYLQRYDSHCKALLSRRGSYPLSHPEPVATTWQLSFEEIQSKWPISAELLTLCAFLDADAIPEDLLMQGAPRLGPILGKVINDPLQLDSVLESLHAYSLIRRSSENHSVSMHRLVQTVLRQNLSAAMQELWAKRVIRTLDYVFPEVDMATWAQCKRLLPQVQACIQLFDEYALFLPETAHLFIRAGDYTCKRALYRQAEAFFQRALTIYKRIFSPEDPSIAHGLYYLGELYRIWGRYKEAEPLFLQALAIYQQALPPDHLDIAREIHGLGELYRAWGRYKEAEPLFLQALAIYQQALPPDHLDIASTLNDLGELYHNVGRYQAAETLFSRALSTTERISGPDHPTTIKALHCMARLYHAQQRYQEAERIYHQVFDAQVRIFGAKHSEIAVTLNNLAINYRSQRNYVQAEALLKRALHMEEEMRGPYHPRTAITLHNLAVVYKKQEHYQEAEDIFRRALQIKEASLGPTHQSTVKTITDLAHLYLLQQRYTEARELLQRAQASQSGEHHPYMAIILRNLAFLSFKEGLYAEAEQFYLQALAIHEMSFPVGRLDMITALEALANLYRKQGREEEAVHIEQRAIKLKE